MKKYPVSRFYNKIYYLCLLLLLAYEALLLLILDSTNLAPMDYIDFSIGILGIIIILYLIITDLSTANFSFSNEGITMYIGFKKYNTPWSEFICAGIVAVNVEAVKCIYTSDLFWVYFSKSFLTDKEKRRFLSKTRKDQTRIAYFQYSKPVFDLVLEHVPENLRKQLKEDEEFIIGQMNFWEKVYNK